ncbi:MAG: hypothetical protein V1875_09215 [Candidatus Altiarchaeota archaeon]
MPLKVYEVMQNRSRLNASLIEVRENPPAENRYFDECFVLVHYNLSKDRYFKPNGQEIRLAGEIDGGRYEMIFIGPEDWDSQIGAALDNDAGLSARRIGACVVYAPVSPPEDFVKLRMRDYSILMFRDSQQCMEVLLASKAYFESIFEHVCQRDEWTANLIRQAFDSNGLYSLAESGQAEPVVFGAGQCSSGANLMTRLYSLQRAENLKIPAVALFVAVWLLISRIYRENKT